MTTMTRSLLSETRERKRVRGISYDCAGYIRQNLFLEGGRCEEEIDDEADGIERNQPVEFYLRQI